MGRGEDRVAIESPGHAEVDDLWLPVFGHEDIARLQVAVEDAPRMGVTHRVAGFLKEFEAFPGVQAALIGKVGDGLRPGDEFHHEVGRLRVRGGKRSERMNLGDTRMVEAGEHLRLPLESPQRACRKHARPDDLHRHRAIRPQLPPQIDAAHAALGDQ